MAGNWILAFLFLVSIAKAEVFYVTSLRYRGNSKGDITQAVANAWRDACASPWPAKVIIPKWEYYLRGAILKGPCKAPIEIQVQGYLRAPQDRSRLIQQGTWVRFQHNLMFDFVTNSIIKGITSLDSKYFYINAHECRNVTLQYLTITAPEDSHSTDGIHIGSSFGITINHTTIIGTGDDCVSVIGGSKNIIATNFICGPGHGISIGSLGKYPNEEPVTGVAVKIAL
ncbi:hypothetical protein ACFX2I_024145 [Malus domestica]